MPASTHLDGFDISLDAAPPQEWMPANVSLHERDMLQPIPDELVEKYDIVNIRLFMAVVYGRDPEVVAKNFLKLLSRLRSAGDVFELRFVRCCCVEARKGSVGVVCRRYRNHACATFFGIRSVKE